MIIGDVCTASGSMTGEIHVCRTATMVFCFGGFDIAVLLLGALHREKESRSFAECLDTKFFFFEL